MSATPPLREGLSTRTQDDGVATYAVKRGSLHVIIFGTWAAPPATSSAVGRVVKSCLWVGVGALAVHGFSRPPRHRLSTDMFRVGSGPWRVRMPLTRIESVTNGRRKGRDRSVTWAMASHGLLIRARGRKRMVFISPADASQLVCDLAARCPHLELRESGLLRDPGVAGGSYVVTRETA